MSPLFLKTNNNNKKFPLVPEDPAVFRYKRALKKSSSHVWARSWFAVCVALHSQGEDNSVQPKAYTKTTSCAKLTYISIHPNLTPTVRRTGKKEFNHVQATSVSAVTQLRQGT